MAASASVVVVANDVNAAGVGVPKADALGNPVLGGRNCVCVEVVPGTYSGRSVDALVSGHGAVSCKDSNEGSAGCPPLVVAESTECVGGWDVLFEVANSRLDDTEGLLRDVGLSWSAVTLCAAVEHSDVVRPR